MARSGVAGQALYLRVQITAMGQPFDPLSIDPVALYDEPTNGTLLTTLIPSKVAVGLYQVVWNIPAALATGTYFDTWTWELEGGLGSTTSTYSFTVTNETTTTDETETVVAQVIPRTRPHWLYHAGLESVRDVGNGLSVELSWFEALPSSKSKTVYYNLYEASRRVDVFDSAPTAITTNTTAVISATPGNQYFFAVRATEFNPALVNVSELTQISADVYQYLAEQILEADIDAYAASLTVQDTTGFPTAGFIQVDYEVLYYASKDPTHLNVDLSGRGQYSTPIVVHSTGAFVQLFKGIEDGNTIIVSGTVAWSKSNPPQNTDAIGEFNVDADGYRTNATDIITTDLTASDAATVDFPSYDYNSYHRPSMQTYFKGGCENSYAWGELNGQRGVGLQAQELSRLDMLLQVDGEPVVLFSRKQTGRRCRCLDLRHENPNARCEFCLGTGFEGGFDRYVNTRAISEAYTNTQGMILVRVSPYDDDVKLDSGNGLTQVSELTAWTINVPTIKDRSLLLRFNQDGSTEFLYECQLVNRSRLQFGLSGQQTMKLKRLDKTSILYSLNWQI